jgi:hypothetical protein
MISPKRIVAIILSMLMLSLMACGSSDDDPVSTTTTTTFDSEDLFYATMRETTPVYDPISAEGEQEGLFGLLPEGLIEGESPAWGNEVLLYKVYFTLRDFRSPRDEGVVDRSNLSSFFTMRKVCSLTDTSLQRPLLHPEPLPLLLPA